MRIEGDPDQPYTAGFACAKVNRDAELVHSPERLATPLRRIGPKGEGRFAPITWDTALDEITSRWQSIVAESGPLALLGYCYSSHQGLMNRGLPNGLFHAMGTSRLWAGTVCDSCMDAAWEATVGPIGGADPEIGGRIRSGDLLGRRPVRHQRALLGKARSGAQTRRAVCGDRPTPYAVGAERRLAHPYSYRHRCGACSRHHAHSGARQSVRPRLYRAAHAGLRPCRARRATALCAGPRRRHHRRRPPPMWSGLPRCMARPRNR